MSDFMRVASYLVFWIVSQAVIWFWLAPIYVRWAVQQP